MAAIQGTLPPQLTNWIRNSIKQDDISKLVIQCLEEQSPISLTGVELHPAKMGGVISIKGPFGPKGSLQSAVCKVMNYKVLLRSGFYYTIRRVGDNYRVAGDGLALSLDHPNINSVYGVVLIDTSRTLAKLVTNAKEMGKYVGYTIYASIHKQGKGIDLQDHVIATKRDFTIEEVRNYTHQLLKAVAYMQSKGIIHRDIKPNNILYDKESDSLSIIDFETLKHHLTKNNRTFTMCGTIEFTAPEVLRGDHHYDGSVDVYSVASVAYYLYFKRYAVNEANFDHFESVDPLFRDFIARSIYERLSIEEALQHDFFKAAEEGKEDAFDPRTKENRGELLDPFNNF